MAKFKLTWANGVVEEVVQSDRDTIEGYIDCRFGAAYDNTKVKIELVRDEDVAEPPKQSKKTK